MDNPQIPDFGGDFPEDDDQPINGELPVVPGAIGIPDPAEWGALALELSLMPFESERICRTYKTTPDIVLAMLGMASHPNVQPVKAFQLALREAKNQIKALGPDAGFILRARTLSESHLLLLDQIARNPHTPPQVALKAIELSTQLARLHPGVAGRGGGEEKASAVGVMVNITMGAGLPVPESLVIDAVPTQPPEDL